MNTSYQVFFEYFFSKKNIFLFLILLCTCLIFSSCKKDNGDTLKNDSKQIFVVHEKMISNSQKGIPNDDCTTVNPLGGNNFPNVGGTYFASLSGTAINVNIQAYRINYVCEGITYTIPFNEALGWEATGEISVAPGYSGGVIASNGSEFVIQFSTIGNITVNWAAYNIAKLQYQNTIPRPAFGPKLIDYVSSSVGGSIVVTGKLIRSNYGSGFAIVGTCYPTMFNECYAI